MLVMLYADTLTVDRNGSTGSPEDCPSTRVQSKTCFTLTIQSNYQSNPTTMTNMILIQTQVAHLDAWLWQIQQSGTIWTIKPSTKLGSGIPERRLCLPSALPRMVVLALSPWLNNPTRCSASLLERASYKSTEHVPRLNLTFKVSCLS